MLKLNASYSKKVPVDGREFSSQSYHASVEVEIPDGLAPESLQERIRDTFDLVRRSVEDELREPSRESDPFPAPERNTPASSGRSGSGRASGKQLRYLTDLAVRKGLDPARLDAEVRRLFGAPDLESLTRRQASQLIDRLGSENGEGRAA